MKRMTALILCLCLALALVGCGSDAPAATGPKDFVSILSAARSEEDNSANVIFTYKDGKYAAHGAYAQDLTQKDIDSQAAMCMSMLGLVPENIEEAAFSVSLMMVHSYGIAIVKPTGAAQPVIDGLQTFIDGQKAAQQNYLADQYEIASNAKLEKLRSGQVVLVMSEGQDKIFDSMEAALK